MTPQLSEDQRQAIEERGGEPVYVVDAETNKSYVLLPADQYENVRSYLEELFDPRDIYPFVDRVMAEDDANDPTLEGYQNITQLPS
jgi:hypothetical protein